MATASTRPDGCPDDCLDEDGEIAVTRPEKMSPAALASWGKPKMMGAGRGNRGVKVYAELSADSPTVED